MSVQGEEKHKFITRSGIPVNEVYTEEDIADMDIEREIGIPGQGPYVRGIYEGMYRTKPWIRRQVAGYGTAEDTNERFKYLYNSGQNGFCLVPSQNARFGLSPSDPRVAGDVGVQGASEDSMSDTEKVWKDIPLDKIFNTIETSPMTGLQKTAMYLSQAEDRGYDLKQLQGTTSQDVMVYAVALPMIDGVKPKNLLKLSVDMIEWCCKNIPQWHPLSVNMFPVHESGVNAYQELAWAFADAMANVDGALERGIDADTFLPGITFHMASTNDFFEEIAKCRAARRMWYKITTDRYKAKHEKSKMFRFHTQTSGVVLTREQPMNNIIRAALHTLSAILGGAQSIHTDSYDEGVAIPTEESVLLSLRTQQIMLEETNIRNVVDPLGGSYYMEWLTNELEKKAWDYLDEIDSLGGFIATLESGWAVNNIRAFASDKQKSIMSGEERVVGINCYEIDEEPYSHSVFESKLGLAESQTAKIEKLKRERDNNKVQKALDEIGEAATKDKNVMPSVIKAVRAYATNDEIADIWRQVWGIWSVPFGSF